MPEVHGSSSATGASGTAKVVPSVAVILPCYYSAQTLASCLRGLQRQTLPPDSILVVNSSPEAETEAVVADFEEVRFVQSDRRLLPHAARNQGADSVSADVMVFSDPDCVADPRWLEILVGTLLRLQKDRDEVIVGGSMGLRSQNLLALGIHLCKFHRLLPAAMDGQGLQGVKCESREILPTANVAFSRKAWTKVGPFDGEHFSGDASICWRAAAQGIELRFVRGAVVSHYHYETLSAFLEQRIVRGEDFVRERCTHQRWSKFRKFGYLLAQPLLVPWITLKAWLDACRCGWGWRSFKTLPIQFLGHLAWNFGEVRGLLRGPWSGGNSRLSH